MSSLKKESNVKKVDSGNTRFYIEVDDSTVMIGEAYKSEISKGNYVLRSEILLTKSEAKELFHWGLNKMLPNADMQNSKKDMSKSNIDKLIADVRKLVDDFYLMLGDSSGFRSLSEQIFKLEDMIDVIEGKSNV